MPWFAGRSGSVTVNNPVGAPLVVTFTDSSGSAPTAYSNAARSSTVALPATITGTTTFYFVEDGTYTVSVKAGGVEVANTPDGTRTCWLAGDNNLSFQPGRDAEVSAVAHSTAAQGIAADSAAITTVATYVTPAFPLPPSGVLAGDTYRISIRGKCTSSVGNTVTWTPRLGTAGTTADTALTTLVTTAAVSGTDVNFVVEFIVTFRAVGAAGTALCGATLLNNGTTGIATAVTAVNTAAVTSSIDTTTALKLGVSLVTAAATTSVTVLSATVEKV